MSTIAHPVSAARTAARPPFSGNVTSYRLYWAIPLAAFLLSFFIAPLLVLVWVSLHNDTQLSTFGIAQYRQAFDGFSLGVLGDTLWLGVQVTVLCLGLGFTLAWTYVRSSPRVQTVLMLIIIMPLLTSVIVRTFAWIVILGRQGIVNSSLAWLGLIDAPLKLLYTRGGLIAALANVQLPLMTLPLINALQRIDPNYADASAVLGASMWRTFFRIIVPLSLPGIVAGCLLTFSATITAFITQSLVGGGQMLFMPMYIYQQASSLNNYPLASAISIVFLLAVLLCLFLFNLLGRMSRG
jgi:putative spermidine/putrescine transport system permease protein